MPLFVYIQFSNTVSPICLFSWNTQMLKRTIAMVEQSKENFAYVIPLWKRLLSLALCQPKPRFSVTSMWEHSILPCLTVETILLSLSRRTQALFLLTKILHLSKIIRKILSSEFQRTSLATIFISRTFALLSLSALVEQNHSLSAMRQHSTTLPTQSFSLLIKRQRRTLIMCTNTQTHHRSCANPFLSTLGTRILLHLMFSHVLWHSKQDYSPSLTLLIQEIY